MKKNPIDGIRTLSIVEKEGIFCWPCLLGYAWQIVFIIPMRFLIMPSNIVFNVYKQENVTKATRPWSAYSRTTLDSPVSSVREMRDISERTWLWSHLLD